MMMIMILAGCRERATPRASLRVSYQAWPMLAA
jgi:hypothetical protein